MSNPTRDMLQSLHQQMMQASAQASIANQRLQEHLAKGDGLQHLLRGWRDSARTISAAVVASTGRLAKDGSDPALVKRIQARLADLVERGQGLDLARELDATVASWEQLAIEFAQLKGYRREYLLSLLWSRKQDIDRTTAELSEARKLGGLAPQVHKQQQELSAAHQQASKKYEELRERYLKEEKELRDAEQKQAQQAKQAGAKEHLAKGPFAAGLPSVIVDPSLGATSQGKRPQAPLVIQLPRQQVGGAPAGKVAPAGKPAPTGGGSGGKAAPQQAGPATGARDPRAGKIAPVAAGVAAGKIAPQQSNVTQKVPPPIAGQVAQQATGKQAPSGAGGTGGGGKASPQQAGQAPRREPFAVNVSGLRFRSAFLAGAGGGTATVDFRVKGADGTLRVPPANPITFKFGDVTVLLSRNVVLYPPDAKGEVLGWAMFVVNVQATRPLDAAEITGIRRAIEAQASSLVGSLGRLGHDASSGVMASAISELARRYESGLSGSAPGSKPRPAEKRQSKDQKHGQAAHQPGRPAPRFTGPGAQAAMAALERGLGLTPVPRLQARARTLVRELHEASRQLSRGGSGVGAVADRIAVVRRELDEVKNQLGAQRSEQVAADVRAIEQAGAALGQAAATLAGNVPPQVWERVQRTLKLNAAHAQQQLRHDLRAPLFKGAPQRPGLVPPPLPQPPRPAGKPPVPEFQVEKLNLSFAKALERARTITPRGGIAGHQERDGVAERLHRTFEAMSHATSVALTDVQGGALRTSLARMDAMLGKLKGKTGADLVQGAQEVGLALGELGSLAGSKGSQQLGQLKRLLEERKGELNKLAKDVRGNAAVAIKQAGLLPQPYPMAGGAQLDTLKKLYPGLDKVLRTAAVGSMVPVSKGNQPGGLGGLVGGGPMAGGLLRGGLMGGGILGGTSGGQIGGAIGHSSLGKILGGAHLGGLGGAFHGGLGAFNAGALAGTVAKAARELQKAGIPQHEFGKLLGAAQKGDAGALAKNVQHLAQKRLKLPKHGGKPTKQALAEAFREMGRGGLADKLLGGPIGHMMESAQRSQGQGLGGLASAFLHTAGHSKVSQAVATFEKLRTSGFKPHFSLWSKLASAVSSAASKVTSSISNVVQKVTSNPIIKAIGDTVKKGVSSVGGFVGGAVSKVVSGVSGVVNKVGGFVSNVAGKVASGLSTVTQKAMGFVKTGVGYVTQGAKWLGDKVHQGVDWAKDKVQQGTQWVTDKVHQGVDWAKDKAQQGMEWASEKAQWAKDKLAQGAGWVGSKISQGAKRLYHAASDAWDDAKEFGKGVWDKAKGVGSDLWSKAKEKAGGLWDSVKETASGAWERVKGGASGLWDKAKAFGGKAWEAAKTLGGKAWSGIQQGASWLGEKASGLATAAWNNVKGGWNKLSSVVGAGAGWLKDKAGGALDWAGKKVGSAWGAIKSGAQGAWGWVSDKVGGAWDKAKSAAGGAWDWIKGKAGAAGSWIGEKVSGGLEWASKKVTGIVGGLGGGIKKGLSFLGKVAEYSPLGLAFKAGKALGGWVKGGGLGKLWEGTKSLAKTAWGGIKKGYQAVKGFAQSPLGQGIITGLSLAASFIPGGMLVKTLVGAGIGALGAMADGKDWKQVLLAAGSGALQGALPFMKIGPLAKVGIGALQGAAGSLMAGGNWKDALKGAAGGAMDAFDLGAIKKLKGVKAAEKLLKGGQLSKIEKLTVGGSKTLQFLQKTMANPKVRRTVGAIEKLGSKAIKGGIWLSGRAAQAQGLLDKALSLGSKVDGVLQKVQENAPGVSEFFGGQDTALGRFIGKAGDYAGMGHEKLGTALEWGQKGSDLLSKGRGYLDKGLGFFGVKDPQKAFEKLQARKGARKGDKGAIELDAQQRLEKHKAKEERKQKGRDHVGKGGLEQAQDLRPPSDGALAEATGKRRRKKATPEHEAHEAEHEEQPKRARRKKVAHKEVSLLEKAINKGKELKRKGQNLAQKGYVGLGKVQGYLEKGLEGAGKIQHGLEKASELAKQGAEYLGEDSELGKYLLQMHQKADQVHGYLETGIGYAEQVKSGVDKSREFLDGLEGVGEDYKEDPKERRKKRRKSKTAGESPLEEAQDLDPGAPKKRRRKGKKGEAEEAGPKGAGHPQAEIEKKATPETEAQIKVRKKLAWDLLGNISRQVQQFESAFAKATREVPKLLGEGKSQEATQRLMDLGIYCDDINKKVRAASAAAKGFNVRPQDYEAEAKFYADWHSATKKKLYQGLAEVKGLGEHHTLKGVGLDDKQYPDVLANHRHIFELQAKVIALADSIEDEDAKEHVAALLGEARKAKAELQSLKARYKKDKAVTRFLTGGGMQDKLIDEVIAKLSGAKNKPAGEKGEGAEGGKKKPGKKFDLVKSAKGGLQALQDFQKRAKRFGNKASRFLGKTEKVIGKGIAIGKKVDHGLQKASEYSKQIEDLFGADTGIGDLAHQAGDLADKGHEKLGEALDLAKKGKAGVHKGKEILDFVLGKAHKHHAEKEDKEEKEAKKKGEEITKELEQGAKEEQAKEHKRRGHPDVHEAPAHHHAHGHRGHPGGHREHHGEGEHGHHHAHHDRHHGRGGRAGKHPHHRRRGGRGGKHPHHHRRGHKDHGKLDYHHHHAGKHGHEHGPHAHHEDPHAALAKAAKEVERFSKAVHKGIAAIEKLMHAGKSSAASKKVQAISAESERARLAVTHAVSAAKQHPHLHKQAVQLRNHYLEIRGQFFKFVHTLHGLSGEVGVDLSKYPDVAAFSGEVDTFGTKVAALGDAKHGDSAMQGTVASLSKEGEALLAKGEKLARKHAKDEAAATAVQGVLAKLRGHVQLLSGHGDKANVAKGDKELGIEHQPKAPKRGKKPRRPRRRRRRGGKHHPAVEAVLEGDDARVHVEKGPNRGGMGHHDEQDVDPAAQDTWLGSGHGLMLFSEVFGGFLPAESGAHHGGGDNSGGGGGHTGGEGGEVVHHDDHGGEDHDEGDDHDGGDEEEQQHEEEHHEGPGKKGRRGKRGRRRGPHRRRGKKGGGLLGRIGGWLKKTRIGKAAIGLWNKGKHFFSNMFHKLHGFADKVGGWAKTGQKWLGKGMHYAEMGMGLLNKIGAGASKVEEYAGKAEGFLNKLGLNKLAGFAGKIGGAAGWVGDKAGKGHDLLKTADQWMGKGKKGLKSVEDFTKKASKGFQQAEHFRFGGLLKLFKKSRFGDGLDGRQERARVSGSMMDDPKRLDYMTMSRMERFLGGSFAGVRIHVGEGASEVTKRYNAEAVTVKDHIFFAPGRYNPSTTEGQKLIAHELTHVMQKGRANLDVRTAEAEALHSEHSYGQGPAMRSLDLGRPAPDFKYGDGMGMGASNGLHTAKRTRSKGGDAGGKEPPSDGEEFIDLVSVRVYELLMEEMEMAFESR